jgi:U3 small nucleolar RNA-associated protein 4
MFTTPNYQWAGEFDCNSTIFQGGRVIKLISSPNNPITNIQEVQNNPNIVAEQHHHAYSWPLFTPITKDVDSDVMFFLSKIIGHT